MAENEQSQEKTEEPTQRRLEKAREDGEVLSSKEMMVFASAATALAGATPATAPPPSSFLISIICELILIL